MREGQKPARPRCGPRSRRGLAATVKAEVIPWEAKAGQFGVVVDDGTEAKAYFVGSRSEAEREALRRRKAEDRG